MIPTKTTIGRHVVQTLAICVGLPVEHRASGLWHPWVIFNQSELPAFSMSTDCYGIWPYRIQPAALREWMGSQQYLCVMRCGAVIRSKHGHHNEVRHNPDCIAQWHRSEILDENPPRRSVTELRRLARLGLGGHQ